MVKMNSKEIKQMAYDLGADLCGIASSDRFSGAPEGYSPLDLMPSCKSAIVIGRKFPAGFMQCNDPMVPYTVLLNNLCNMLDILSIDMISKLEEKGIVAITTGALNPTNFDIKTQRMRQVVSAKHCAQAAGLGVIGKNTLLINEEYGNMMLLIAVLTELELEADPIVEKDYCKNCMLCTNICPVHATGFRSESGEPTLMQRECLDYEYGSFDGGDKRIKCFRCRTICPHVLGTKNRASFKKPTQIFTGGYMGNPEYPNPRV